MKADCRHRLTIIMPRSLLAAGIQVCSLVDEIVSDGSGDQTASRGQPQAGAGVGSSEI